MLRVGSTFSGVGGADLGLERAGFGIAWLCESDVWKRSILAAHWPGVPIFHDVRDVANPCSSGEQQPVWSDLREHASHVDLLCGGFPCQDLSVAGKRRGFDGERSVLAFEFLRIAESLRPRWLLMENVPGLLSSNGGRDLARLLDELGGIGYGWAYRILDARYFGVPQRRRRIFICARRADAVGDSGSAAGLALRALWEGGGGDPTPGWPPRQILAAGAGRGVADGRSVSVGGDVSHTLTSEGHDASEDGTGRGTPIVAGSLTKRYGKGVNTTCDDGAMVVAPTVTKKWAKGTGGPSGDECQNLVFRKSRRAATDQDDESWVADGSANTLNAFDVGDVRTTHAVVETASTLQASGKTGGHRIDAEGAAGGHLIPHTTSTLQAQHGRGFACNAEMAAGGQLLPDQMSVRRLTPVECERLMGWPDNWTAPPGVKAPDSKRYAACGDGIVSWVTYWIGCRIQMIEAEQPDPVA